MSVVVHEPEIVTLMRSYDKKEITKDEVVVELMKLCAELSTRVENLEMRLNYSDRH